MASVRSMLRSVLYMFKKTEFVPYIRRWERLPLAAIEEINPKLEKKEYIRLVEKACKHLRLTTEMVGDLALIYVNQHYRAKLWTVYQLIPKKGSKILSLKAEDFQKRMKEELGNFFDSADVNVLQSSALWVRVYIPDSRKDEYIPGNAAYLLIYPGKPFFLSSRIKAAHAQFIFQAVISCLGCKATDQVPLQGRCVNSLSQLALKKYQPDAVACNPVNPVTIANMKRKQTEEEAEQNECIHDENKSHKRKRDDLLLRNYGPGMQPTLEKLTYKLETKFKGTNVVPGMADREDIFPCRVIFEGSSVLEGIKNLAKAGLAELPMKPHLSQVQNMGKNEIVLGQKVGGPSQSQVVRTPAK